MDIRPRYLANNYVGDDPLNTSIAISKKSGLIKQKIMHCDFVHSVPAQPRLRIPNRYKGYNLAYQSPNLVSAISRGAGRIA